MNAIRPFELVSLLDVLKQNALRYVRLGKVQTDLWGMYYMAETLAPDDPGRPLSAEERSSISHEIGVLLGLCEDLNLPVSKALLEKRKTEVPKSLGEYTIIMEALEAELGKKVFFFVPSNRAGYYDWNRILTDAAKTAFPQAYGELRSAGNAYAVDLHTASVFHCMRALEHALRALAGDVGKTFDVQVWNDIINQIESAIKQLGDKLPRGESKSDRLQFLGEAAKEFTFFKDGWRNYVSHGKASYTQQQALTVLTHARQFIERLSTHLHE